MIISTPFRTDDSLIAIIDMLADSESRSRNKQMEYLIKFAISALENQKRAVN